MLSREERKKQAETIEQIIEVLETIDIEGRKLNLQEVDELYETYGEGKVTQAMFNRKCLGVKLGTYWYLKEGICKRVTIFLNKKTTEIKNREKENIKQIVKKLEELGIKYKKITKEEADKLYKTYKTRDMSQGIFNKKCLGVKPFRKLKNGKFSDETVFLDATKEERAKIKTEREELHEQNIKQIIKAIKELDIKDNKITLQKADELYNTYGIEKMSQPMFNRRCLGLDGNAYRQLRLGTCKTVTISFDDKEKYKDLIKAFKTDESLKDRYFSKKEVLQICEENDIPINKFFRYTAGIRNDGWLLKEYKKALDNNPNGIWIGKRHPLSKEYVKNNIGELIELSNSLNKNFCKNDRLDFSTQILDFITECLGKYEKNFAYEGNPKKLIEYFPGIANRRLRVLNATEVGEGKSIEELHEELRFEIKDNRPDPEKRLISKTEKEKNLIEQIKTDDNFMNSIFKLLENLANTELSPEQIRKEAITFVVEKNPKMAKQMINNMKKLMVDKGLVRETKKRAYYR